METAAEPVTINSVTRSILSPKPTDDVDINFELSGPEGSDEFVYLVYSTDGWETYTTYQISNSGGSGTGTIPAQPEGTVVSYYMMTTTIESGNWGDDREIATLRVNNNFGSNYSYTSSETADVTAPTTISDLSAEANAERNSILLTWTPTTETNFDTYEIYFSTSSDVTTSAEKIDKSIDISLGSILTNEITISDLDWGTTYYFVIRAKDQAGNISELSNETSAATIDRPTIVMDGVFDGEEFWGAPIGTGNDVAGWASTNAKKVYMTFDETYVYFGAEVDWALWQKWVFLINAKSGGASVSAANDAVTYAHADLPDFAIVKNGVNADFKSWNGAVWEINETMLEEGIWTSFTTTFVEVRILRSMIEDQMKCDVQFYISGDNPTEHSSFDSVPTDNEMTSWNNPLSLSNYILNVSLPVELVSFTAERRNGRVILNWKTASEKNNVGWEVEMSSQGSAIGSQLGVSSGGYVTLSPSADGSKGFDKIGFIAGNGTTTEIQNYEFSFSNLNNAKQFFRLKQIDTDGKATYSQIIELSENLTSQFELMGNYPNPFNPSTNIRYNLPFAGIAELTVYNQLGQVIMVQKKENAAGINSFNLDLINQASGLYFYNIRFNSNVLSGTMMMVK